ARAIDLGPVTRDGSPVDLYLRLPYLGEVELICAEIPNGASVLEMGCGVGRMTKELLAKGYYVTAIDNSPEMLAHVPPAAPTICSNIEDLELKSRLMQCSWQATLSMLRTTASGPHS